ncbi:serine hydrolase [Streptomyces sp. A0592]|uniref:serine hydrolase n=1 Tax=Streptomyces sp. A0592 TaxID=2563099 RepID=UPI00109EDB2E|nr:serine hydrolase [Streptomyces sp. A0592]THA73732.1 hypothetical protein E6U81_38755 [Streptomyces sp. A0592]
MRRSAALLLTAAVAVGVVAPAHAAAGTGAAGRLDRAALRDAIAVRPDDRTSGGSMTSTTGDLDRFVSGLFDSRLLRPAQAEELFTVPTGADGKPLPYAGGANCNTGPGRGTACFSVGLMSVPLPDGTVLWGKTGSDPGYRSGVFASRDLARRAVYSTGTSSAPAGGGAPAVSLRLALAAFGN